MASEAKFTPQEVIAINQDRDAFFAQQAEKKFLYITIIGRTNQLDKEKSLGVFLGEVYPYVMLDGDDALFAQFCQGSKDFTWHTEVLAKELPKLQALKQTHPELFIMKPMTTAIKFGLTLGDLAKPELPPEQNRIIQKFYTFLMEKFPDVPFGVNAPFLFYVAATDGDMEKVASLVNILPFNEGEKEHFNNAVTRFNEWSPEHQDIVKQLIEFTGETSWPLNGIFMKS